MWSDTLTDSAALLSGLSFLAICLVALIAASVVLRANRIRSLDLSTRPGPALTVFDRGQSVITLGELNYSHGNGMLVPRGETLQLIRSHDTTAGPRWSAYWQGKIFVYPIPEDMIAARPRAASPHS